MNREGQQVTKLYIHERQHLKRMKKRWRRDSNRRPRSASLHDPSAFTARPKWLSSSHDSCLTRLVWPFCSQRATAILFTESNSHPVHTEGNSHSVHRVQQPFCSQSATAILFTESNKHSVHRGQQPCWSHRTTSIPVTQGNSHSDHTEQHVQREVVERREKLGSRRQQEKAACSALSAKLQGHDL